MRRAIAARSVTGTAPRNRGWRRRLATCLLAAIWGVSGTPASADADHVVLQLRWSHRFEFAGFYMAREKGYYAARGLDVEIRPNDPVHNIHPVETVLGGSADYGVGTSGIVVERLRHRPVVLLAAIFQHAADVWITRATDDMRGLHDLAGRRLMAPLPAPESLALLAPFPAENIPLERLKTEPVSADLRALANGQIDAWGGDLAIDPQLLRRMGVETNVINPRDYGLDFYGDCLFTSEREISAHPDRVRAFREASLRGWRYAMDHIDESAHVIHQKYATDVDEHVLAKEGEEMRDLILPELVDIGHVSQTRWQHIGELAQSMGLVEGPVRLDGFLYNPDTPRNLTRVYWAFAGAVFAVFGMGAVALRFYALSRRLRAEVERRQEAEREAARMACSDSLTALYNRRHFTNVVRGEFARARRHKSSFAILICDADEFKKINDTYGHSVGDLALRHVANILSVHRRGADTVARWGGEEFVFLLPDTDAGAAKIVAERLRAAVQNSPLRRHDGPAIGVTISVGVAGLHPSDPSFEVVLNRADQALYQAKDLGRNRVESAPDPEGRSRRTAAAARQ